MPAVRTDKVCERCGKSFYPTTSGKPARFCGATCRMAAWRQEHLGVTTVTCDQCSKVVPRSPSGTTHKNHFCSPACKGKWMSEHLRGTNHPNYKGNGPEWVIAFISRRLHSDPRWHEWSQAVLANSKGLCERCGNAAQEAHHKREAAELLALLIDTANGEALCQDCHVGHHHS